MSTIAMSCLGRMGRWGNQVFQYAFLRSYAERYGLKYEAGSWIGQSLFDHNDPPLSKSWPRYVERRTFTGGHNKFTDHNVQWNHTMPPDSREVIDCDFRGYAQFHTGYYRPQKRFIQSLFSQPARGSLSLIGAVNELRQRGQTVIGLHLRRGDTGHAVFYYTPNEWYLAWLRKHWGRFVNPVLFIAGEDHADVAAFSEYSPVVASDLMSLTAQPYREYNYLQTDLDGPTRESMDWFPDWWLLRNCDVLAIGESTFSFSAAMMNPRLSVCWRSVLSKQQFLHIDPWDAYPLVREHLDDYPGIPGTTRTTPL